MTGFLIGKDKRMKQIQAPNLVSHCESHSQLKASCDKCFGIPWDICKDTCDWMGADGTPGSGIQGKQQSFESWHLIG